MEMIKELPKWLVIGLFLYVASLLSYAVYDKRTVDFFPPKIYEPQKQARPLLGQSDNGQFIVLQVAPEGNLNSARLSELSVVELVDVDSLSDSEVASVLDKMRKHISGIVGEQESTSTLEKFFLRIVRSLDFGPAGEAEASKIFSSYIQNKPDVDDQWGDLVRSLSKKAAVPKNFAKRVKVEPFALLKITEDKTARIELVLPTERIKTGGKTYSVPVIANPSLTATRGIHEAIVLQPEAQR